MDTILGPHPLALFTRVVHLIAMAFMLGGSLLLWGGSLSGRKETAGWLPAAMLTAARRYEGIFWLAAGLVGLTGVGNLGAFGASLPGTGTAWGIRLGIKLALVLAFLIFSLPRTLLAAGLPAGPSSRRTLGVLYAVTSLFLTAILVLAVSLSHG